MDINFKDLTINREGGKIIVSASFKTPKPSEATLEIKYANSQEIKKLLKQNNIEFGELLKNDTLDTRYPKTMSAEWIFSEPVKPVKPVKKVKKAAAITSKPAKKATSSKSYGIKKKTTKKEV